MFIVPFDAHGIVAAIFFIIAFRLHKEMDIIAYWYEGSKYEKLDKKLKDKGKRSFWKLNSRKEKKIPAFRDGWHLIKQFMWLSLFLSIGIWDILYGVFLSVMCLFVWWIGHRRVMK